MSEIEQKTVEQWLDEADFKEDPDYVPSLFALEFITFIKLVNGGEGEENKSPILHYRMLDQIHGSKQDILNMVFRGAAKSTLLAEYLFLWIAVTGGIPGFGDIKYALYVSDSIDNGVKKMRLSIENRYNKSEFLQSMLHKDTKFTDVRWYFKNNKGVEFVVSAHGAKTGVRGTKELNTRPQLAVLDDLISDDDARSPTVIAAVEDVVDKAIEYALHPTKRKVIWSGTPFNSRDPLYKAVESGAYYVNVYPACNKFPCTREEFQGAWSDRFTYDVINRMYQKAKKKGKIYTFNQEMMLRIMSDEDRLVTDTDIVWYPRDKVLSRKGAFNFYITTDFATTDKQSADFSVISVWAYNNNGDWLWVDGIAKKQLMDKNLDDLFRFAQIYKPQSVGIEVSGQQGGFIQWIQNEMMSRNIYFTMASDKNSGAPGIRPVTNKLERFNVVLPQFKLRKIWFPEDIKDGPEMVECMDELRLASASGFRSKHDDFIDTISMLPSLTPWKPTEETTDSLGNDVWADDINDEVDYCDSYIV